MKHLLKCILSLTLIGLISTLGYSQNFEGAIVYSVSYESNNEQMSDAQWKSMMGDTQEYYIKDGNYKSVMNGSMMQWQVYDNVTKRLYSKMSNSETALWNDVQESKNEVLSAIVNKGAVIVLGYECDELILECRDGMEKYYFNSSLQVDASLFKDHKLGNWYEFLKRSKALPLKMIVESEYFTAKSIAVKVEQQNIAPEFLELPVGIATAKSPY